MDKKYQIFISSTYEDLKDHRLKVRDAILSMYHFPVGMELFGAADEEQWEIIKETIDTSDYYVLIIGNRYGSIIEEGDLSGKSYTEKEFLYAKEKGIPILAFLVDESLVINNSEVESEEKSKKLLMFREKVKHGRLVDFWINADDLATKVSTALYKQISRSKRPGWIRGDSIDVEKSLSAIVDLNTRVKDLEYENKRLLKLIVTRVPKLHLDIEIVGQLYETDNTSCVTTTETGLFIRLIRKHIQPVKELEQPHRLSLSDVPDDLKSEVTVVAIDEYNKSLPKESDFARYYSDYTTFQNIKQNGYVFDFAISNEGTAKATDITLDISFPDQFMVMGKTTAESYASPKPPSIPRNPISEAQLRKTKSAYELLLSDIPDYLRNSSLLKPTSLPADLLVDHSKTYSINVEDGEINIWRADILHTRQWTAKDFYIVPLEAGVFTVKGCLMCEQYSETEEVDIKIEVVEE